MTDHGHYDPAPVSAGGSDTRDPNDIAQEFRYLLEKSHQLFAGLKDLPPTGRNWQSYFHRTFEVYTKLWKFQQQHRHVLENKDYYGLKRWDIGEVASKIGQLYYHYYLRTSETNYLQESYVFYDAVRARQYFKDVLEAESPALAIKKLRYYARFIVVCLFLNKNDTIKKLVEEFATLIDEYSKAFNPPDAAEWNVVLSEISTFLEAQKKTTPVDREGQQPLSVPSRLHNERTPRFAQDGTPRLMLQEAILVGNYQNQIRFSELTLDMYRLLQSLEREPALAEAAKQEEGAEKKQEGNGDKGGNDDTAAAGGAEKSATRRTNPHKYLLYRPTFAQLMHYIATAFKDINENSAMLLYLSADGAKKPVKADQPESSLTAGYSGGVATAVNLNFTRKTDKVEPSNAPLTHCLHPCDLLPWTRKPMFVIVESTNSVAFKEFPKVFAQTTVILMSPTEYPASIRDNTQIGSLFTLFLHAPVKAFAFISNVTEADQETWDKCITLITDIENTIADLFEKEERLDFAYKRFLQDDFLRQFLTRYVFCDAILHAHTGFKDSQHFPSSFPPMLPTIASTPEITSKLQELTNVAGVDKLYNFPAEAPKTPAA
ncbi:hypothetical protein HDU85_002301 [Gaertneriomyces sp. JEL0708]|nr:hypothetical protein HDU85_002301 [Gaertneriomyces sp. JEL0708]